MGVFHSHFKIIVLELTKILGPERWGSIRKSWYQSIGVQFEENFGMDDPACTLLQVFDPFVGKIQRGFHWWASLQIEYWLSLHWCFTIWYKTMDENPAKKKWPWSFYQKYKNKPLIKKAELFVQLTLWKFIRWTVNGFLQHWPWRKVADSKDAVQFRR